MGPGMRRGGEDAVPAPKSIITASNGTNERRKRIAYGLISKATPLCRAGEKPPLKIEKRIADFSASLMRIFRPSSFNFFKLVSIVLQQFPQFFEPAVDAHRHSVLAFAHDVRYLPGRKSVNVSQSHRLAIWLRKLAKQL